MAESKEEKRGLVLVITGDGKGKTTSALGQAVRAMGHGFKVFFLQFMKGRTYGEHICAEKYLPNLTVRQCGLEKFVIKGKATPADIEEAREGLEMARQAIFSGEYDMVILDEINICIDFGLIPLEEVVELIKNKPAELDLVLTGRRAPQEIIDLADTVSEVKEIKHAYAKGIKARAGIEF